MKTYYRNLKVKFVDSDYEENFCKEKGGFSSISFDHLKHILTLKSKYGYQTIDYSESNYKLFGEIISE